MRPRWPTEPSATPSDHSTPSDTLVQAIAVTAEVCGRVLSSEAADMLARDLSGFDEGQILAALARCRLELHGVLSVPDILARLDDGRPDAEEAWAMMPRDEAASVVWTEEMTRAWGAALPLLNAGDASSARRSFQETYRAALLDARIRRKPVRWTPSLGNDPAGRESVLIDAVQKHRLSPEHAGKLLPDEAVTPVMRKLVAHLRSGKFH